MRGDALPSVKGFEMEPTAPCHGASKFPLAHLRCRATHRRALLAALSARLTGRTSGPARPGSWFT